MQRKAVLIFTLLITVSFAQAQVVKPKAKAHPVTDSIAVVMCNCILSGKDSLITLELLYGALNGCLKNATPVLDDLLKEDGFVQKDDRLGRAEAIRNLGKKLGQKVADECSGFKTILTRLTEEEKKKELH